MCICLFLLNSLTFVLLFLSVISRFLSVFIMQFHSLLLIFGTLKKCWCFTLINLLSLKKSGETFWHFGFKYLVLCFLGTLDGLTFCRKLFFLSFHHQRNNQKCNLQFATHSFQTIWTAANLRLTANSMNILLDELLIPLAPESSPLFSLCNLDNG